MINLMIVDDEERARVGIRDLIDWHSYGVTIIAEAQNGEEALKQLPQIHVDILLSDIRMPQIDGLTLIRTVREIYPHIKSVIMSGHNDFSYVKQALSLGASEYLLKPSRRQEILDTILNVISEIKEERQQAEHLHRITRGFRESLPLLKEKFLSKLVLSDDISYQNIEESLRLNEIHFPNEYFGVIIIQIDNFYAFQQNYAPFDIELLKYGLKNITEDTLDRPDICLCFEHNDDIIGIINARTLLDEQDLINLAELMKANAKRFLKLNVSVGIGVMDKQLQCLKISYMIAVNALDANYYLGPGKIVNYLDNHDNEHGSFTYPVIKEKAVIHAVINGDLKSIEENMTLFHKALIPAPKEYILKYSLILFFTLYRLCIDKNIALAEMLDQKLHTLPTTFSKSDVHEIYNELLDAAIKVSNQLNLKKSRSKLFESILTFVQENYHKDISRDTVASEVYITPGYLSHLFKQQTKTNFVDYLHKVRIDNACILLQDSSRKIGDVAYKVGYNDEKYFFQVFKKYMGMTPNQYRNNLDIHT